jgi:hypothetical protein
VCQDPSVRCAPFLFLVAACADWQRPPLTAPYRADEPLVQEQALVGLARDGSAAAVQLIDAEGTPPRLELLLFDAAGGPTQHVRAAPELIASSVARRMRSEGHKPVPLLGSVVQQEWPEVLASTAQQGFAASEPILPDLSRAVQVKGAPEAGAIALLLHVGIADSEPRSFVLLLGVVPGAEPCSAEEQLATQPISGTAVPGAVWMAADTAWLLSGSIADGEPLRRAVGLRRGSLRRGEAQLHNAHGLALRRARDLPGAEREFERAAAADSRFFDAIYNAASLAADSGRDEAAMALLRRAAQVDRRRLEVLGRDDESLARLRSRADMRELLGMKRPPPDASK